VSLHDADFAMTVHKSRFEAERTAIDYFSLKYPFIKKMGLG
jgi:hypothetical protein